MGLEDLAGASQPIPTSTRPPSGRSGGAAARGRRALGTPVRRPTKGLRAPPNEPTLAEHWLPVLKDRVKLLQDEIKVLREGERNRSTEMREAAAAHKAQLALLNKSNSSETLRLVGELRRKERELVSLRQELASARASLAACREAAVLQAEETDQRRKKGGAPMAPDTAKQRASESRRKGERRQEEGRAGEEDCLPPPLPRTPPPALILAKSLLYFSDENYNFLPSPLNPPDTIISGYPEEIIFTDPEPPTKVDAETLYEILVREHVGLHMRMHSDISRQAAILATRRVEELEREREELESRLTELREENDLLEFRLLEMEHAAKEAAGGGVWHLDDVSDSGVTSLPTSEDEPVDPLPCEDDDSGEVHGLTRSMRPHHPPFSHSVLVGSRAGSCDSDEWSHPQLVLLQHQRSVHTQTEPPPTPPHPLSQEIQKLEQIRERIEEQGSSLRNEESWAREAAFYRWRVEEVEARLAEWEEGPGGDKETRARVERGMRLRAELRTANSQLEELSSRHSLLQEHCAELEEQENDTRLRCHKLELKVSSLGEKKSSLKAQLEQNARIILNLKNSLMEEERKRREARELADKLEALVQNYEKKNFELEEREAEAKYRLQMLESSTPALMMWNMWRMMGAMHEGGKDEPEADPSRLEANLAALENRLMNDTALLEESRRAEERLKEEERRLEAAAAASAGAEDAVERLAKLASERFERDRRIAQLESREKLYQETLRQADNVFADMEGEWGQRLVDTERRLEEQEGRLAESEGRAKLLALEREAVEERLGAAETEAETLREELARRLKEKRLLEAAEERLRGEVLALSERMEELAEQARNDEKVIEGERRAARQLQETVDRLEAEYAAALRQHNAQITTYKKEVNQLGRELMENEVTINELKEEVQTLELAMKEASQKAAEGERTRTELESRLERAEAAAEEASRVEVRTAPGRSLQEEMAEAEFSPVLRSEPGGPLRIVVRGRSEAHPSEPVPALRNDPLPIVTEPGMPLRSESARRFQALIEQMERPPVPALRRSKQNRLT